MGGINGAVGIEKIRVYPTQLQLDLSLLAKTRGYDVEHMHQDLMVYARGLNPPWEDPVTMAVNAALPMLTEEDRHSIGLLIVGTETGLDQEKSLSSWVHRFLQLPSDCRHFEVKAACYSGTAAFRMAISWILSGIAKPGQKALIITTDQSLHAIGKPWEYIGGSGATAILVSDQPDFLAIETQKFGIHAHEVSDVIRPHPWVETGNSEDSLFSYLDGLVGAYENYVENVGEIEFDEYFAYNIYHVPFAGISYRAHKQLLQLHANRTKKEVRESFEKKTLPSIQYPKRIGATYGGSVFIALLSLCRYAQKMQPGDRIGIFSYGSGSCAEFYSGLAGLDAKKIAQEANLEECLDNRFAVSVEEYETLQNLRVEMCKSADFSPDFGILRDAFSTKYKDKGLLVYKGSQGYYRSYEFG